MAHRVSGMSINLYPAMWELNNAEQGTRTQESKNHSSFFPRQRVASFADLSRSFTKFLLKSSDRETLIARIKQIVDSKTVPEGYCASFVIPFYKKLVCNSQAWFDRKLQEPDRVLDRVVQAIFQNFGSGDGNIPRADTEALREVISDLYKNFQDEFCTSVVPRACPNFSSPVPNWSNEELSTYSDPKELYELLGVRASIVNVPSRYAKTATLAWGCLPHEVAGHDLLAAYPGALQELLLQVRAVLRKEGFGYTFKYWEKWFEEATSDVLGVMNMGPAAAFALIGFLRTEGEESIYRLSSTGYMDDEHPIDLVRGYLVARVVRSLKFEGAATVARQLRQLVREDVQENRCLKMKILFEKQMFTDLLYQFYDVDTTQYQFRERPDDIALRIFNNPHDKRLFIEFLHHEGFEQINESSQVVINDQGKIEIYHTMPLYDFFRTARLIARAIRKTKLSALDGRSFSEIRSWNDRDEGISNYFRKIVRSEKNEYWYHNYREGYFAAHVVSAAIMESITEHDGEEITRDKLHFVFRRMISILQSMNEANPEWQRPPHTRANLVDLIRYGT